METPEFDIERLAKEIDEVFQNKQEKSFKSFDSETNQIIKKREQELDRIVNQKKEAVREVFSDIRGELLQEMQRGKSQIILERGGPSISIGHLDHPKMEDVIQSLYLTRKAMLVGPAGTGKTYMVQSIADRLELPFYKYSCSRDSSVHDLLGYKQPKSETYLETTFLKAYENGGIFLVDEYDAMSGDMALFFNGVADNSSFISVPHRDTEPQAKKHKDFYLVMCGNTWGKGSTDYSGRDFQDMALMDRFRFSRHFIDYHIEFERSIFRDYENIIGIRKSLEKQGSYLSTRNVEDMANLVNAGKSMEDIVKILLSDLEKLEQEQIIKDLVNFGVISHEQRGKQVVYRGKGVTNKIPTP